ncbi:MULTISPECIES: TetR/AcrR family transcriptional regulator [unclassified Roseovarius]|uniref:TetR/AcrR family transcriptional regulator n=1 Tax=unclassified Roseovarius TaxID=2614913 RepID=UPI00273D9011|nr:MULTISPECIES: TetR/AcrR family transcriptional regulator [unclassified Roseovarius]
MTKPTPQTKEHILVAAETAILAKGFSATSIDELIAEVGISKSGFFYHFRDKTTLARALLERYIEQDAEVIDDVFTEADDLSEDPLHNFLIALKLLAKVFDDLPNGHPGCVVASVCYHEQLFDQEVRDLNAKALLFCRARFRERIDKIADRYQPRIDINLDDLADMLSGVADGGIILSRVLGDRSLLPKQLLLYRDFIRLVFDPA